MYHICSIVRVLTVLTCATLVTTKEGRVESAGVSNSVSLGLISNITSLLDQLKDELRTEKQTCQGEEKNGDTDDGGYGAVYTRWGRKSCPRNGTELVYEGFTSSSWFRNTGGTANYFCLPMEPIWDKYQEGTDGYFGTLHGTEYRDDVKTLFFFGENLHGQNAPCAVCQSRRNKNILMVPGRTSCFGTWTKEYHGYLMGNHHAHGAATEFICVDAKPEKVVGQEAITHGAMLYFVEAKCDALPCPPYVNGAEIPCVVCTK